MKPMARRRAHASGAARGGHLAGYDSAHNRAQTSLQAGIPANNAMHRTRPKEPALAVANLIGTWLYLRRGIKHSTAPREAVIATKMIRVRRVGWEMTQSDKEKHALSIKGILSHFRSDKPDILTILWHQTLRMQRTSIYLPGANRPLQTPSIQL